MSLDNTSNTDTITEVRKKRSQDCLTVNEIFSSRQGEGVLIGAAAQFIRFSGCNLRCKWCDTKYAWATSRTPLVRPAELIEHIKARYLGEQLTILTGGEPLAQKKDPLIDFCTKLKDELHRTVLVETNASIFIPELIPYIDYWSLSPKTPSSGQKIADDALDRFLLLQLGPNHRTPSLYLKFVISNIDDFYFVKALLERYTLYEVRNIPIVLQPDNSKSKTIKGYLAQTRWLVSTIVGDTLLSKLDVRVIPQLHQLLWWKKRGV